MKVAVGLVPLTGLRVVTAWTAQPAVILGCALLAGSYLAAAAQLRRAGRCWSRRRTVSFLGGVALLAVVGLSFLAVYDDTLFWTRAVQGVVLLLVAPLLLAAGAPLTLAQATLPNPVRAWAGRVRRSTAARTVTLPPVVTLLLVAPPFVIYLTGLYALALRSEVVSGLVSLGLLGAGFVYVASRLQVDPMPRRTHHGLTLAMAVAEVVADGILGLVLWFGPLVAAGHDAAVARHWGPDPRTDQVIGAGVWWIGGDLAGLPFLGVIMTRFAAEDARQARLVDAELDARDARNTNQTPNLEQTHEREQTHETMTEERAEGSAPAAPGGAAGPARPRLWWEDDPRFADRFRRR